MTRKIIIVALSILAVLGIARYTVIAAAGDSTLQDEVMKAEDARNQALPKGDVAALEQIYADDLVYTNATGALLTKKQHLAELKGRALHFTSNQHIRRGVQGNRLEQSAKIFECVFKTRWALALRGAYGNACHKVTS